MMRKINIRPFRGHSTAWLTGCCPAGMKEDLRLNEFSEEECGIQYTWSAASLLYMNNNFLK